MDIHVELRTTLAALHQAEIRREVAAGHLARQARRSQASGATLWSVASPVMWLRAFLSQAPLGGSVLPPAP